MAGTAGRSWPGRLGHREGCWGATVGWGITAMIPGTIPLERPLVPVVVAQVLLDLREDAVLAQIESGNLGWAWDIRRPGAVRRDVRVWRTSILSLWATGVSRVGGPDLDGLTVTDTWLPHRDVRVSELARWWSCSGDHVLNLVKDGLLAVSGERPEWTGVGSSTRITRGSVVAMLEHRRVR